MNAYIRLFWKPKKNTLPYFLAQQASNNSSFFVLQIGANDGLINDPIVNLIRKYKWKGVLLEPQPYVFNEKLAPLYSHQSDIKLENAAISKDEGVMPLHIVSFSQKRWATGLASFVKESLEEKINNGYIEKCAQRFGDRLPEKKADYLTTIPVPTISFQTIFNTYNLKKIDLLQIDTEGYDWEIIQLFPFEKLKPQIISFEIERLNELELQNCVSFLKNNGYSFQIIDRDGLAILENS